MPQITTELLTSALKHHFGYDSFRLNQEKIITSIVQGKNVLAIMPTGGGKSVCYQLPALLLPGVTIVVSPLIALMKDQVDALEANGICAAYLNSTQSIEEQREVNALALSGKLKLLYIAPERIPANSTAFIDYLKRIQPSLFAIDEAHCISSWGHDFRPEYLKLAVLKEHFPDVPVAAFTASADGITQQDIVEKLAIPAADRYVSSFNRPNIWYYVWQKSEPFTQIANYIAGRKDDCGIVYALSRLSTEQIAADLKRRGINAAHYHAGMDAAERSKVQEAFKRDEIKVIVATIAFGMGIDKPNVRYVLHHDVPKNIEGYYQETGRAGRDGLRSDAVLLFSAGDVNKLKYFATIEGNEEQTKISLNKLRDMERFCVQDGCRRKYLLQYFGETFTEPCGSCDYCLSGFEEIDITEDAQKVLSAIARTGERYGAAYIIDFLRGSAAEKIVAQHKELKTYGIGKGVKKEVWQKVINQLLGAGALERTEGVYPALALNDKSWRLLKGDERLTVAVRLGTTISSEPETTDFDEALFLRLKDLRQKIANGEGVPPYVVLADNTLQELAIWLPARTDDLAKISGFGDYKISRYGSRFLEVVCTWMKEQGLESRIAGKAPKPVRRERTDRPADGSSQHISLVMFNEGMSVTEIAQQRGMVVSTIEGHLARFIATGELNIDKLISPAKQKQIADVIATVGTSSGFKAIRDLTGEDVSYGEIRIMLEHLKKNEQAEQD